MRSNYINGTWTPSADPGGIDVVNPANQAVIDRVPAGHPADVDQAVRAAREAFAGWSTTPVAERAQRLDAARQLLEERADQVAAVITADMGSPLVFARKVQVGTPLAVLASYVELLAGYDFGGERTGNALVVREPAGVVGAITPWNYPLHQVVAKVAAALAAGCTVVLKPSEVAPLAAYELADIFHESGLPAGVFNLVSGTGKVTGEAIAGHRDVDVVSFTGSVQAGRRVAEVAAATIKRVTLELGGKSANVILPDADLATAVKVGVAKAFVNSGQTCNALTRMLVAADDYDEAVDARGRERAAVRGRRPAGRGNQARPAGFVRAARPRRRLHRARRRRGRQDRGRRHRPAARPGDRQLRAADGLRRRHARDDDRPRGDLRAGAGRSWRTRPRTRRSRSRTGRRTAWPAPSGRPIRNTPCGSPGSCGPARWRSTAGRSTSRRRLAGSASPATAGSSASTASRSSLKLKALLF